MVADAAATGRAQALPRRGAEGPAALAVRVERTGPDHPPNALCHHVYRYRPCWAVDGCRRLEPIGPTFATPREAHALLRRLVAADPPRPITSTDERDLPSLAGPPAQLSLALAEPTPAQI